MLEYGAAHATATLYEYLGDTAAALMPVSVQLHDTVGTSCVMFGCAQPASWSLSHTITCPCCYDEVKGTQDLKISSHSLILILTLTGIHTHSLAPTLTVLPPLTLTHSIPYRLSPTHPLGGPTAAV